MTRLLFRLSHRIRNRHLFLIDVGILLLAPAGALFARLESVSLLPAYNGPVQTLLAFTVPLKLLAFWYFGFYRCYWRFASVSELHVLLNGSLAIFAVNLSAFFVLDIILGSYGLPRSFPFIDGTIAVFGVTGVRLAMRLLHERRHHLNREPASKRVLIVGAGSAGSEIARAMLANPQWGIAVIGFLDDDRRKHHLNINGLPVLGSVANLPKIAGHHEVDEVIIAIPSASGDSIRRITDLCIEARVSSKIVPSLNDILGSRASVSEIRPVRVEDLLRRSVVQVNTEDVAALLKGMRIMVTGAGGSIGSELCRQIVASEPDQIVLLGHGENSIFEIASELRKKLNIKPTDARIKTIIADIRDRNRMREVFRDLRPQIVFHAAAHKHVGLMEGNVVEAVTNNVFGTKVVAELSKEFGVHRFVMISSDKAVNPTSVMGVTKRIAELVVREIACESGYILTAVRFGNVLGSRGSVIPIFERQLAMGGPLTVSHPDATRFFMTIPEAVQLVLQASALATGGEVFVLDMGDPVSIKTVAEDFIRLSGYEVGKDIDIIYTGLQAGEKMSEELAYDTEQITRSRHEKILICRDKGAWNANWNWKDHDATMNFDTAQKARMQELQSHVIDLLIEASRSGNTDKLEPLIKQIVPQFGRTAFIAPHERKTIVTPQQARTQVSLTLSA